MSLAPSCVKACPFVSQRWATRRTAEHKHPSTQVTPRSRRAASGWACVAGSQRLSRRRNLEQTNVTCEATADALRGSRCLGVSPRVVAGKSVVYSLFVNALSDLRQQRSSPRSRPAIGAMATICSMAGGSSLRGAFGVSWKEDTVREAWRPRRRPMMKLKNKKVTDNGD